MALRREVAGFAGALLLHVAMFAWLGRMGPSHETAGEAPTVDLDLENVPQDVENARQEEPAPSIPAPPVGSDDLRPVVAAARAAVHAPDRAAPSESSEPSVSSPSESGSAFAFNPSAPGLSNRSLGLDGHNLFLVGPDRPDGAAPSEAPVANVAPGVDRSMRDALQARDHALGLDVGGPILAIAEELTRPSDAPMEGRAVLEITLDEGGAITSVRVIDAASERISWERLASQLATALRSRRVALRTKGRAMVVTMEVSSRWTLPSGSAPGHPLSDLYARPGDATGASVGAGGNFDVSDIGSRPHRDVHARILHEQSR
jgi:hypothetical protein